MFEEITTKFDIKKLSSENNFKFWRIKIEAISLY